MQKTNMTLANTFETVTLTVRAASAVSATISNTKYLIKKGL